MINKEKAALEIVSDIDQVSASRKEVWINELEIERSSASYIIKQAVLGSVGQFNYWEENKTIAWPNVSSEDWFKVTRRKNNGPAGAIEIYTCGYVGFDY